MLGYVSLGEGIQHVVSRWLSGCLGFGVPWNRRVQEFQHCNFGAPRDRIEWSERV